MKTPFGSVTPPIQITRLHESGVPPLTPKNWGTISRASHPPKTECRHSLSANVWKMLGIIFCLPSGRKFLAVYLASDASTFTTGTKIRINGGFSVQG